MSKLLLHKFPNFGIAFLFVTAVLLSLVIVSAATMFALEAGRQETIPASMLAQSEADYQTNNVAIRFGQVNPQIIIEATKDSAQLAVTPPAQTIGGALRSLVPDALAQLFPTPLPPRLPLPEIVNLDPEILQTAVPINANTKTPTPTQPTASATPTNTITATSGPTQTATPTQAFVATATTVPTTPPTATFTPTYPPPPTQPPATNPPPPPAATSTNTAVPPTSTAIATSAATATSTVTTTPTATSTAAATATATTAATATATATQMATATPTSTATATATPTVTPIPCTGSGFPNVGPPNGNIATIACGQSITIDLGASPLDLTPPDGAHDLVYYEMQNPPGFISVDWVIIEISQNGTDWIEVFNWGDGNPANNGGISGPPEEPDNYLIPLSALYNGSTTGIAIDADAFATPGTYQYIRITSPLGGENDGSEVDSIQLLP